MAADRWWTVAGAALAQTVGMGPLLQFTFSVFLLPLSVAFGADRGQVSIALASALIATALAVPFAGRLYDRRPMAQTASAAVIALAALLLVLAAAARTIGQFTALFVVIGAVASLQTPLAYTKAVTLRFDRDRGLALGLALTGVGLGTIAMPQIADRLIAAYGWRGGYGGLAVLLLALALPGIRLCMRGLPPPCARDARPAPGLDRRAALREGRFWRLLAGLFLAALAANGTLAHLVPLARDAGFAREAAVGLLSLAGISSIVGRIAAGRIADRRWAPAVAASFFVLAAAGIAILLTAGEGRLPWIAAATLIGLGLGAEADLMALLVSRYYGQRSFGELFGLVFATFLLASSLGPLAMGIVFAQAGGYAPAMAAFIVALLAAAGLFLTLGRYRFAPE